MKTKLQIAFAGTAGVALGIAIGAADISALAASAAPKAYMIANLQEIKDQATYDKYRAVVRETEAKFGGGAIVRAATPVKMDKSTPPPGQIFILEFPSMKALQDWWNSPEYVAIRPLREAATVGANYAVEGIPAQ